jgi:hypothetical protein
MGRIRTIKPEFWLSEDMASATREARLLAIALLNYVDREGRCEDRPARIKAALFPYETDRDFDIESNLSELASPKVDYLVRYEVGGKKYLQIKNFLKHQRPNVNESASAHPEAPLHENDRASTKMISKSRDASIVHSLTPEIHSHTPELPPVVEKPPKPKKGVARPWPEDLTLTPEMREYARRGGVGDPDKEFRDWRNYCDSHGKTYIDWSAAWRTRIDNAPKYQRAGPALPNSGGPEPKSMRDELRRQGM